MSARPGEKRFIESERLVIVWKLRWVVKKRNCSEIKEMSFDCKYDAYNLMCMYLKRKKCAWIERHEKRLTYRVYEDDVVKTS